MNHGEIVERKKYKKYSDQDRSRILEAANRGNDWSELAASLGICYKTAHNWVVNYKECALKRGGNKPKILTENEINDILSWVEEKSDITLKEISNKIYAQSEKRVALSTISNTLHGRMYTVKGVHSEPSSMNNELNKTKRREYVQLLNEFVRDGKQVVWLDETNFNLFCRRKRGWSRCGTRAVQTVPTSRGPNIHLIGTIGTSGVIKMCLKRGSFNANAANGYVEDVFRKWEDLGNNLSELVVVCDNAPCHSKLERLFENSEATLLRLSPYSPMLNPIETIWGKIKAHVKSKITIPNTAPPNVGEQRLIYLESLIDEGITQITVGDCSRAIQHSTTFHQAAADMQNMPVGH
ncbi:uncharacterized protein LOC124419134 [Lucilia cuprina]|uniref:uncharacterized protein LOC124419134 n=1 Tax=Lucilia cuprina TaxID=7375 RepID=UPI001F05A64E|nr:uncharacterized protein LOC124419134 [Lucilia cuprina]